jgi:carbamoyl-phosphate synthase small subunit
MQKARLALEDGTVFSGYAFGQPGEVGGEIVFNTSMTGYQEILTDPSYCGQIVTMTYPLIGNYGVNAEDFEAKRPFARGMIVREFCRQPSNWRSAGNLDEFMKDFGLMGLEGIDTRALTKRLRTQGTMKGIISISDEPDADLIARAGKLPELSGQKFVKQVSTTEVITIPGSGSRVVLLDFGAKGNTASCLSNHGCEVIIAPWDIDAADIESLNPQGIMLSNGPGDPKDVPEAIGTIGKLLTRYPIFGICLGHQLLALSLGGNTYKMKFGHRGGNHPVKDLATGRVYITSQNHGFAVEESSLKAEDVTVSHRNVNDGTVEGLRHRHLPLFSVQYHPEAAPGPMDSEYLFGEFFNAIQTP